MRNNIIVEEELNHNVLAGFKKFFAMSSLGHLLILLFDEGVDAFAATSAVANLDMVPKVDQMNTSTLSGVIPLDVEDFGVPW